MRPYVEVRKRLLDNGLTVAGMARLLGENQSYVYDVLTGRRAKTVKADVSDKRGKRAATIKRRVAEFLGVSPDDLWPCD